MPGFLKQWTGLWWRRIRRRKIAHTRILAERGTLARLQQLVSRFEAYRPQEPGLLAHPIYGHLTRAQIGLNVIISVGENAPIAAADAVVYGAA